MSKDNLDINTPKGQVTLAQERRAIQILKSRYVLYDFITTPKTLAADVDYLVMCVEQKEDKKLKAVMEVSCRNASVKKFRNEWGNEWLRTRDKLVRGIALAKALQVPFSGVLYCVPDDTALVLTIWTPKKGIIVKGRSKKTETQKTVNGGTAKRMNCYLSLETAVELKGYTPDDSVSKQDNVTWLNDYCNTQKKKTAKGKRQ